MHRTISRLSLVALLTVLGPGAIALAQPQPVQLAQNRAPRLVRTRTTNNRIYVRQARYYFSVEVPPTAINPIQKIQIQQRTGGVLISLRPEQSSAFLGTSRRHGEAVELESVTWDRETAQLEVVFAEAIAPGETVTVALRPVRNPRYSGEYSFGVTVFAPGEEATGLYLGPGRLRFYEPVRDRGWP